MRRPKNEKLLRQDTNYPMTPVYVVEVTSYDIGGSYTYEASIPKAEFELGKHLSKLIKDKKLSEEDMVELESLIELYGREMYRNAEAEAAMDAAGPDL